MPLWLSSVHIESRLHCVLCLRYLPQGPTSGGQLPHSPIIIRARILSQRTPGCDIALRHCSSLPTDARISRRALWYAYYSSPTNPKLKRYPKAEEQR